MEEEQISISNLVEYEFHQFVNNTSRYPVAILMSPLSYEHFLEEVKSMINFDILSKRDSDRMIHAKYRGAEIYRTIDLKYAEIKVY